MKPTARKEGLFVVRESGDSLVLLDKETKTRHELLPIAVEVWKSADGTKTVSEIAEIVSLRLGIPKDEDLIWSTLDVLADANLLMGRLAPPAGEVSRSTILKRWGAAAAAAVVAPVLLRSGARAQPTTTSCDETEAKEDKGKEGTHKSNQEIIAKNQESCNKTTGEANTKCSETNSKEKSSKESGEKSAEESARKSNKSCKEGERKSHESSNKAEGAEDKRKEVASKECQTKKRGEHAKKEGTDKSNDETKHKLQESCDKSKGESHTKCQETNHKEDRGKEAGEKSARESAKKADESCKEAAAKTK